MKSRALGLAACLAVGVSGACLAQDLKATQKIGDTQIGFDPGGNYGNYTLTITGPNGIHISAASKAAAPSIDLRRLGAIDDGTYNYHLTASTEERVPVRTGLDNGRDAGTAPTMFKDVSLSGQFQVKGGTIVKVDPNAREDVKRQK